MIHINQGMEKMMTIPKFEEGNEQEIIQYLEAIATKKHEKARKGRRAFDRIDVERERRDKTFRQD